MPSEWIATYFAAQSGAQELDPLATLKLASGGFEPREVIEVAVNPTGLPCSSVIVITETPDAWRRNTAFRASIGSVSREKFMVAPRDR
jgi:hypothetical protein